MFDTLPKDSLDIADWNWTQFEAYFDDLENRPLTDDTVAAWLSDLNCLMTQIRDCYRRLGDAWYSNLEDTEVWGRYKLFQDRIHMQAEQRSAHLKLGTVLREKALLDADVLKQLQRLKCRFIPQQPAKPGRINGRDIPPAMRQFLYDVQWPPYTFRSDDDSPMWVWLAQFGMASWLDDEYEVRDRGDRPLIDFGMTDGGNYLLLLDLDDPNPANPRVYQIDHYDPEQTLGGGLPLARFLSLLEPEMDQ